MRGSNNSQYKHAFTIIEVLLAVAVLVGIAAAGIPVAIGFLQRSELSSTTDLLETQLRTSQERAQVMSRDDNWGVYISTGQTVLFKGTSYAARDSSYDQPTSFNPAIVISGVTEVVFTKFTGEPSTTGTITLTGANGSETITINNQGAILR